MGTKISFERYWGGNKHPRILECVRKLNPMKKSHQVRLGQVRWRKLGGERIRTWGHGGKARQAACQRREESLDTRGGKGSRGGTFEQKKIDEKWDELNVAPN